MLNDNLVKKSCGCGGTMTIHMHTLVYSTKTKITHVPVYTCGVCRRYEPLPSIKKELGKLIGELEHTAARRRLSFADRNEWASVLKEVFGTGIFHGGFTELEDNIRHAVQARIDVLLDVYRLAVELADLKWMEETGSRLAQLAVQSPENAK
ncbi:hypothetical protein R70723_13430 [Paenibacillus sp. FSL R7-0273]|uniref:hypothetical protein n=1 Tax=Paenibacillus sp. FSL R7-0273 TaxID=1536772 RepID=UPI0004F8C012|nr:hypothetical protein [Paenibacillus sp. FSL R7-0273]AIQ46758.1 hypothetical protein R70723_13430 [Paenibacillus sp. FSL R7-0273]OMF97470.1 hypothetical protein BK144_02160 [Paenibacillus sp. FSL R7-0273]